MWRLATTPPVNGCPRAYAAAVTLALRKRISEK
jgi:hypothetical protein